MSYTSGGPLRRAAAAAAAAEPRGARIHHSRVHQRDGLKTSTNAKLIDNNARCQIKIYNMYLFFFFLSYAIIIIKFYIFNYKYAVV